MMSKRLDDHERKTTELLGFQLAQIRERLRTANRDASHVQIFDNMDASLQDMPRLLEAVEAVLGRLKEISRWTIYYSRDCGEVYPVEAIDDLVSEIHQDLTEKLGADDERA